MKKFTLNIITTLVLMIGMALNVNAAGMFENLEEAQAELDKNIHLANDIALSGTMDAAVFEKLQVAIIEATAVWDSDRVNDINEINNVMPVLLSAMDEAQASIEKYKPLDEVINKYNGDMLADILAKSDDLEFEYWEDEEMWDALSAALSNYRSMVADALTELKGCATEEMLTAVSEGKADVAQLLKEAGIVLPSLDEYVNKVITGIDSVVAAPSKNGAAYSLNGNKVSEGYKGIVIKGGKKFVVK